MAEAYLSRNDHDKAVSHLIATLDESPAVITENSAIVQNIIEKLVEADEFELISKLVPKLKTKLSRRVSNISIKPTIHGTLNYRFIISVFYCYRLATRIL